MIWVVVFLFLIFNRERMSISRKFEQFCNDIRISNENNIKISSRYKEITKRLNKDFWDTDSEIYHSLYV